MEEGRRESKFEEDLKAFFPDIYRLNVMGKWDKFFWEAVNAMIRMSDERGSGEITVRYNGGRIDALYSRHNLLYGKSKDPNLSEAQEMR